MTQTWLVKKNWMAVMLACGVLVPGMRAQQLVPHDWPDTVMSMGCGNVGHLYRFMDASGNASDYAPTTCGSITAAPLTASGTITYGQPGYDPTTATNGSVRLAPGALYTGTSTAVNDLSFKRAGGFEVIVPAMGLNSGTNNKQYAILTKSVSPGNLIYPSNTGTNGYGLMWEYTTAGIELQLNLSGSLSSIAAGGGAVGTQFTCYADTGGQTGFYFPAAQTYDIAVYWPGDGNPVNVVVSVNGAPVACFLNSGATGAFSGIYKATVTAGGTGYWGTVADLNPDPTFATPADWTLGTGWTISGNTAVATAAPSGSLLEMTTKPSATSGQTYAFTYTLSNVSSCAVGMRAWLNTGTFVGGSPHAANGTYTDYLTAASTSSSTLMGLQPDTDPCSATVTNFSIGTVSTFAVTFTGGGCTTEPSGWTATASGGVIASIANTTNTLASWGTGCTSAPTPVLTAGGGTGGTATSTLNPADISSGPTTANPAELILGDAFSNWPTGSTDNFAGFASYPNGISQAEATQHFASLDWYRALMPTKPATPVPVVVNNDFCADMDGPTQLWLLENLQQMGYVNVLMVIDSEGDTYGPQWAQNALSRAGMGGVPVTQVNNSEDTAGYCSPTVQAVTSAPFNTRTNFPGPTSSTVADLNPDPTFATPADWTLGTGWTISGNTAVATAAPSGSLLEMTTRPSATSGQTYAFTYTLSNVSSCAVGMRAWLNTGTFVAGPPHTANGTYTDYLTAASTSSSTPMGLQPDTDPCSATVTNFSIGTVSTQLRQLLAAQPNGSVVFFDGGGPTWLAGLLNSTADGYSSDNGVQLVTAKVAALYSQQNTLTGSGSGGNWALDETSAGTLLTMWPSAVPMYVNGLNPTTNGPGTCSVYPTTSVPYQTWYNYGPRDCALGTDTREQWDPYATVFSWMFPGWFTQSASGLFTYNTSTGAFTFSAPPADGQYYTTAQTENSFITQSFQDSLLWTDPARHGSR